MLDFFDKCIFNFLITSVFVSLFYFALALNYYFCFSFFKLLFFFWVLHFIFVCCVYLKERLKKYDHEN